MTATVPTRHTHARSDFRSFLKSVGLLAVGRQVSALLFVVAVLILPRLASRETVDGFLWAYYAVLLLTSVLGLGLERAAGLLAARSPHEPATAFAPLLVIRALSVPLVALALWATLAFVGVALPVGAWWATLVWITAVQVQVAAYAAVRSTGNRTLEPRLWVVCRLAETALLLGLAAHHESLSVLLGAVAAVEVLVSLAATRALRGPWGWRDAAMRTRAVPWRTVAAYAGIELLSVAYLRADLLLVGRLLGPVTGATYGLLYRVVDGLLGLQGAANFWLFTEVVRRRERGEDAFDLRRRSLLLFPWLGAVLCAVLVPCTILLADAVPRIAGSVSTLRLLLAAFPLAVVGAIELFARSADGRQRQTVTIMALTLAVNTAANLVLLPTVGLAGAAVALVVSESVQGVLLVVTARDGEHSRTASAVLRAAGLAAVLLVLGWSLTSGTAFVAVAATAVVAALVFEGSRSVRASVMA